jgi:hypothetical protein
MLVSFHGFGKEMFPHSLFLGTIYDIAAVSCLRPL